VLRGHAETSRDRVMRDLAVSDDAIRFDAIRAPSQLIPGRLLRVAAALALIGGSAGLFIQTATMSLPMLEAFLRANALADDQRLLVFVAVAAGAFLGIALGGVYLLSTGGKGAARVDALEGLERLAITLRPLIPLGIVPTLLAYTFASQQTLVYLCLLAVFGLTVEWSLRGCLSGLAWPWRLHRLAWPGRLRRQLPLLAVIAGAIFYAVYFSKYTLLHHRRFGTSGFDLGIHVNWAFNALHGQPWRCPVFFGVDGGHFIGNHAIFAMFFAWLPLFALKPGPEILLVYQAVIVGAAAIPMYLFGRTQIPRWAAATFALLYLLYAPVHGPNFYDFHELMPLPFWCFCLFWAIATRRNGWVAVFVFVLYAHREDVAVGIAVLGLFLIVTGARPRLGTVLAVVSIVWFIIIKFIIMPLLFKGWFQEIYKELQAPGHPGYGSVVQTVLINPSFFLKTLLTEVKANYFLHIMVPLVFLPLRRPALALLGIPGFFFTLLTTGYPPTVSIAFHYTLHGAPYLLGGAILMLRVLSQAPRDGAIRRNAALGAMAATMFFHSYAFGAIFQHNTFVGGFGKVEFTMTPDEEKRYAALQKIVAMIPKDASVAASESEMPHVAARVNAYDLRFAHGDADFLLVRAGALYTPGTLKSALDRHRYGLVASEMGIYLFRRDADGAGTDAARTLLGAR